MSFTKLETIKLMRGRVLDSDGPKRTVGMAVQKFDLP